MYSTYKNPLTNRYSTKEMAELFGDQVKFTLWRRLWIALAESQKELGLNITYEQIRELKKFENQINIEVAIEREKKVRHDVMAHIYAYGCQAKVAAPIIHLGATSCFVTDNADIIIFDQALGVIKNKLLGVVKHLANFALCHSGLPTLGYTHLQAAQVTTVGKRTTLWIYDLMSDYCEIVEFLKNSKLRGAKGTTGTQASYLTLFGDDQKVKKLDSLIATKMGYSGTIEVTSQTYSRKRDYRLLTILSNIAQSSYKFASDLRLLQSFKELEEPFESDQVGSSAMAHKKNPMRSERLCSLARFVIGQPNIAANTVVTQWLERTLDDSAIRRIAIPEAFLALDGVLNLFLNIASGLKANYKVIENRLMQELPFMATESILMECVKSGGDRQKYHELIRKYSWQSAEVVKNQAKPNDLIDRLKADTAFDCLKDKWDNILDPILFTGRAKQQTEEYIKECVLPILKKESKNIIADSVLSV